MAVNLMRLRDGTKGTTNIELFFDLVYVFATTQLSHRLVDHPTAAGAAQSALLLAMVWLAWSYTMWVTNWLDPERLPVRLALLALMAGSLALSAGLPRAFGADGLEVGISYAAMQIGRSAFAAIGVGPPALRRNFQRILVWCVASGALAILGGLVHGHARELAWVGTVAIDLGGGAAGFWTPGLGRSVTADWTVEGDHLAERCQAFLLIALGEAVVVIGASLSDIRHPSGATIAGFVAAFVGCAALWWVYFDRSAVAGAHIIAASDDPGRLGRSAYHFIHPVMVAGIIVTAAADERVVPHPLQRVSSVTAWMILGGTGLYLAGHALFKVAVWRRAPWTRLAGLGLLALLATFATHLDAWALGGLADAVLIAVVVSDRVVPVRGEPPGPSREPATDLAGG